MEVNSAASVGGAQPINPVQNVSEAAKPTEATSVSPQDTVEISSAGRMLETLSQSPEIRPERLAQIKAEIEAGTYETPEKLDAALEKLLDEINTTEDENR